ncbi:MAG: helix-turn-helix domain-containing protein [Myxococcales bacterium]|nr:helix-turn-helix domain-containing protein [Myxococcales bacterium]
MTDGIEDDSGRWLYRELVRLGLPAAKLFDEAGLDAAHRRGEVRPPWSARVSVSAAAARLLDDPCLGFDLAGTIEIAEQGVFTAALVHAPSMREMLDTALAHLKLWEPHARLDVESDASSTRLYYAHDVDDPLGAAVETQISLVAMSSILLHRIPALRSSLTLGFACAPPRHARCASTLAKLDVSTRFHQPRWYAEIPTAFVDEKLPGAHPVVNKLLHERIAREHARQRGQSSFLERLRSALREGFERRWSAGDIAAALELSTRTLQHRLKAHGTSLTQQQTLVRIELARTLLARREHTVEEVASRVGFDSLAAFSRFFRRHTGLAPSSFRSANSASG